MDDRTILSLEKLFEKHRIVFWYDEKKELREEFESVSLDGIEKIEIANNEFMLKHKILREQIEQKFFLYHEGPKPTPSQNWLLDVLLSHVEFRMDQAAIIVSELGLDISFIDVVREHSSFFKAKKRVSDLKTLLHTNENKRTLRRKILAVCAGTDIDSIDSIIMSLIEEEHNESYHLIKNSNLEDFLWEQVKETYGYESNNPSINDFIHEIFKGCLDVDLGHKAKMRNEAKVFLKGWKGSSLHSESYRHYAQVCEKDLDIKHQIELMDFRALIGIDYFECIDKFILVNLIHEIQEHTITFDTITEYMRKQRYSFWYNDYIHLYEAIRYASWFLKLVDGVTLTIDTLSDGVRLYTSSWFLVDQLYRKFHYHVRESGQLGMMEKLNTQIENQYSNKYLLKLNDRWQNLVDLSPKWKIDGYTTQRNFYTHYIHPYVQKERKVCVIISDAMRYEVGEELSTTIRSEDRFTSVIEPLIASLPSYTQLGMASLLPHKKLSIKDDAYVLVDGKSSQGLVSRDKILKQAIQDKAIALDATKVANMKTDDLKNLIRDNFVLYIYHDRIDSTGGDRDSTEQVHAAAEQTIREITVITKKLFNCNANNVIVTADHGFIYQDRVLDESDFIGNKLEGEGVVYSDRRIVLGRNLPDNPSLKHYTSQQLDLAGDIEVQIAKSINRLRKQGAGSRFVHGGSTLQEAIVPVVLINKKRTSDIGKVDVEVYSGGNNRITSGQLAVKLYQEQPTTDKLKKRILKVGLYTKEGELISESKEFIFDNSSNEPRNRESIERFVLSNKGETMKRQEVYLRLEEPIEGTNQFILYKQITYIMQRQISTDFDF